MPLDLTLEESGLLCHAFFPVVAPYLDPNFILPDDLVKQAMIERQIILWQKLVDLNDILMQSKE